MIHNFPSSCDSSEQFKDQQHTEHHILPRHLKESFKRGLTHTITQLLLLLEQKSDSQNLERQ